MTGIDKATKTPENLRAQRDHKRRQGGSQGEPQTVEGARGLDSHSGQNHSSILGTPRIGGTMQKVWTPQLQPSHSSRQLLLSSVSQLINMHSCQMYCLVASIRITASASASASLCHTGSLCQTACLSVYHTASASLLQRLLQLHHKDNSGTDGVSRLHCQSVHHGLLILTVRRGHL